MPPRDRAYDGSPPKVLDRFRGVRRSGTGWAALCPAHPDKNPSLSISIIGQKVLLNCFVGCTFEAICKAAGIERGELFLVDPNHTNGIGRNTKSKHSTPPNTSKQSFTSTDADVEQMRIALTKHKACLDYIESRGVSLKTAAELRWGFSPSWSFPSGHRPAIVIPHYTNGKLVGIKARTISGDRDFSQAPGSSVAGLYGTPDLTRDEIVVLEGPIDCALTMSHGLNAVALNSATSKPAKSDIRMLSAFDRVFLVGDMDAAGLQAISDLQKQLPAEKVVRVRIPGFKDIGEMYAESPTEFAVNLKYALRFARASRDPFELEDLLTEIEIQAGLRDTSRYVVDTLVPKNCITMVFGEEKSGKSMLVSYISKCVANGVPVFGKYPTVKTPVVYFDLENCQADIQNFIRQFSRVGTELIRYRTRITGCPALDSPGLLHFCEKHKPLLVLDSLTKFSLAADPFNPKEMSQFFDLLLNLCAAGATIILIHHSTRDDAERYANSHQIGANVTRAFAVVSEDRPTLNRVRLEGKLFRGAEPVSVNLIAFPVIEQTGHFGIADFSSVAATSETDMLLQFVLGKGGRCKADDVKKRKGYGGTKNMSILKKAVEEKKLGWEKRVGVFVPDALTQDPLRYEVPGPVRTGTNDLKG